MLKIGEFSRLSHLTVKALRFYEKEGILLPASTDEWTGYRLYETALLEAAANVKACRQLGLSINEIRAIQAGADVRQILTEKAKTLIEEKSRIDGGLSIIHHTSKGNLQQFLAERSSNKGGHSRYPGYFFLIYYFSAG